MSLAPLKVGGRDLSSAPVSPAAADSPLPALQPASTLQPGALSPGNTFELPPTDVLATPSSKVLSPPGPSPRGLSPEPLSTPSGKGLSPPGPSPRGLSPVRSPATPLQPLRGSSSVGAGSNPGSPLTGPLRAVSEIPKRVASPSLMPVRRNTQLYSMVDSHALQIPLETRGGVPELARRLCSTFSTPRMKIRSIYRFVTHNIGYSLDATDAWTPEAVLASGETVCQGFAELVAALATAAGLEAEVISGFRKSVYGSVLDDFDRDEARHAWNAVRIDGKWLLLDATWDAGYLDEAGEFVRQERSDYFLVEPEVFVLDHLPEDRAWQLLPEGARPVSKSRFARDPRVRSVLLEPVSHPRADLDMTTAAVDVDISVPEDVVVSARLLDLETAEFVPAEYVRVEEPAASGRKTTRLAVTAPSATGLYRLLVRARNRADRSSGAVVLSYLLTVHVDGGAAPVQPARVCAALEDLGLKLVSHQGAMIQLRGASKALIKMQEGGEELMYVGELVGDGKTLPRSWVRMARKRGGVVEATVRFPQTGLYELKLFARRVDAADYELVVAYHVDVEFSGRRMEPVSMHDERMKELGAVLVEPKTAVECKRHHIELVMSVGDDADLLCRLESDEDGELSANWVQVMRSSHQMRFKVLIPKGGNYTVIVYGRKKPADKKKLPLQALLSIPVVASLFTEIELPLKTYPTLGELDIRVPSGASEFLFETMHDTIRFSWNCPKRISLMGELVPAGSKKPVPKAVTIAETQDKNGNGYVYDISVGGIPVGRHKLAIFGSASATTSHKSTAEYEIVREVPV